MTGVLMWDKPKQVKSKKDWAEGYGFEDGPTGGYAPNMSEDDTLRWKAKVTGQKLGFPQVEIRKSAGSSQMTIIVNLGDGYNYKYYRAEPAASGRRDEFYDLMGCGTYGQQVHMSMNGPAQLSLDEMKQLDTAIEEAKEKLNELVKVPGPRSVYGLWMNDNIDYDAAVATINDLGAKVMFSRPRYKIIMATAPLEVVASLDLLDTVRAVFSGDFIHSATRKLFEADYQLSNISQKLEAVLTAEVALRNPAHV